MRKRGPKSKPTAAFLRAAADPEQWLAYAEALRIASNVAARHGDQLFRSVWANVQESEDPNVILLPIIDLDFLLGEGGPLAPGYPGAMSMVLLGINLLLAGYAFENLAKGVLVARAGEAGIEALLTQWKGGRGHDLVYLVEQVGIRVEEGHRKLLSKLQEYTTQLGRYPTPLTMPPSHGSTTTQTIDRMEHEHKETLWRKLMEEFMKERKRRYESRLAQSPGGAPGSEN